MCLFKVVMLSLGVIAVKCNVICTDLVFFYLAKSILAELPNILKLLNLAICN